MSNKVLIISNANELVRVRPERIVYVESDGNYSTMMEDQLGKDAIVGTKEMKIK